MFSCFPFIRCTHHIPLDHSTSSELSKTGAGQPRNSCPCTTLNSQASQVQQRRYWCILALPQTDHSLCRSGAAIVFQCETCFWTHHGPSIIVLQGNTTKLSMKVKWLFPMPITYAQVQDRTYCAFLPYHKLNNLFN